MDKHLNIFQAYHGGNHDSPDKVNRLEDNLTRAFVICMKYLQDVGLLRAFLQDLGFSRIPNQEMSFDLQNLEDKDVLKQIQNEKNRPNQWLLLVGRRNQNPTWKKSDEDNFKKLSPFLADHFDTENDRLKHLKERGEILKELKKTFKNKTNSGQNLCVGPLTLHPDEVSSIYDLLHECRPDAWIYQKNSKTPFSILIETKVGTNLLSNSQVFRHLSGELGLKLGNAAKEFVQNDNPNIISTTWDKINRTLEEMNVQISRHPVCKEIVTQFNDFMKASGEVLDLKKLNDDYDPEFAKNQFPLFLDLLDKAVLSRWGRLARANRHLDGLWDYYGISNESKIKTDPHISIYFNPEGIGCSLTVKSTGKILKILNNFEEFKEHLSEILENDGIQKQRYQIQMVNYRLLDHKKGQIRGDKYDSFVLTVNLEELARNNKLGLSDIYEIAKNCAPLAKQLDIHFGCTWVDPKKAGIPQTLRSENLKLINDPKLLVAEFTSFISKLVPILEISHQGEGT